MKLPSLLWAPPFAALEEPDSIRVWRERILLPMLIGISLLGMIAVLPVMLSYRVSIRSVNLLLSYSWVVSATILRYRSSFRLRAIGLLVVIYLIGTISLHDAGLSGAGREFYLAFTVLASILLGMRVGLIALVISIISLAVAGWAMTSGVLPLPELRVMANSGNARSWITGTTGFMVLATMAAGSAAALVHGLGSAIHKKQLLVARLREEQNLLEQRVADRTQALHKSNLQLQQAYADLHENQEKLLVVEKMASLGRLTAGIAHEMNTPLAAVRAALAELDKLALEYRSSIDDPQVLSQDHHEIAAEMQRALRLADRSAERAASFVRGIKGQTRDMSAHERRQFALGDAVQEALLFVGHALRASSCTVALEAPDHPIVLYGVPGRMVQVVTNLVMNAIEANRPGVDAVIRLRLSANEQAVSLQVYDEGCGIAPEHLPKIFDPMFTTKPFGQGTGLGLTIVHDVVTCEFGGSVAVVSQPDQGTTFTLSFPHSQEALIAPDKPIAARFGRTPL